MVLYGFRGFDACNFPHQVIFAKESDMFEVDCFHQHGCNSQSNFLNCTYEIHNQEMKFATDLCSEDINLLL